MPSLLLKLADLGFTAHGCYRDGDCEKCAANDTPTWFRHNRWVCDECVLNTLLPAEGSNMPRGRRICSGCEDPLPEESISDYCDVCEISLRLIRRMQEDGSRGLWTIPEMRFDRARNGIV